MPFAVPKTSARGTMPDGSGNERVSRMTHGPSRKAHEPKRQTPISSATARNQAETPVSHAAANNATPMALGSDSRSSPAG